MNDKFVRNRSFDFVWRVNREAGADAGAQIRFAWQLALGRAPSATELGNAKAFLDTQARQRGERDPTPEKARELALADVCQVIFAMNEFLYVD